MKQILYVFNLNDSRYMSSKIGYKYHYHNFLYSTFLKIKIWQIFVLLQNEAPFCLINNVPEIHRTLQRLCSENFFTSHWFLTPKQMRRLDEGGGNRYLFTVYDKLSITRSNSASFITAVLLTGNPSHFHSLRSCRRQWLIRHLTALLI